jgi:hypothetical protein
MAEQPRVDERDHYGPVKSKLEELFRMKYKDKINELHLEITANGKFSNKLKNKLGQNRDIIFSFLRAASPDISGFVEVKDDYSNSGFIIAEIKREEIKLDDIYQARKYAELYEAKHAFLVSAEEVQEEIKRLSRVVSSLLSLPAYRTLSLCQFERESKQIGSWFPKNPFIET